MRLLPPPDDHAGTAVTSLAFSPDGTILAAGSSASSPGALQGVALAVATTRRHSCLLGVARLLNLRVTGSDCVVQIPDTLAILS